MQRVFRARAPEHIIVCLNKSDLAPAATADDVRRVFVESANCSPGALTIVHTTCTSQEGAAELTRAIAGKLLASGVERTAAQFVFEARHKAALEEADAALRRASLSAEPELTAVELREALAAFASILGLDATTDVLDRIFSQFCIGK
jgi:tRNA modification GTPase